MRKTNLTLFVIGLMLAAMLIVPTALASEHVSDTRTLGGNENGTQYWAYRMQMPDGGGVKYTIKSSGNTVNVYLLDEENMGKYAASFDFQYDDKGSILDSQYASNSFTVESGTYYIVVENPHSSPVTFSYDIEYGPDVDTSILDGGLMGMFAGAMCIVWIVLLIIEILILRWIYRDAKKRGKSGGLWVLIVLFTGLIGIIIWLLIRPPVQPPMPPQQYGAPQYQQPYQAQPQQQYYQPPPQPQQPYQPPQDDPYQRY